MADILKGLCHGFLASLWTAKRYIYIYIYIHLIQKRLLWALAVGHWEVIVWRSLKQSISLFSYVQTGAN